MFDANMPMQNTQRTTTRMTAKRGRCRAGCEQRQIADGGHHHIHRAPAQRRGRASAPDAHDGAQPHHDEVGAHRVRRERDGIQQHEDGHGHARVEPPRRQRTANGEGAGYAGGSRAGSGIRSDGLLRRIRGKGVRRGARSHPARRNLGNALPTGFGKARQPTSERPPPRNRASTGLSESRGGEGRRPAGGSACGFGSRRRRLRAHGRPPPRKVRGSACNRRKSSLLLAIVNILARGKRKEARRFTPLARPSRKTMRSRRKPKGRAAANGWTSGAPSNRREGAALTPGASEMNERQALRPQTKAHFEPPGEARRPSAPQAKRAFEPPGEARRPSAPQGNRPPQRKGAFVTTRDTSERRRSRRCSRPR